MIGLGRHAGHCLQSRRIMKNRVSRALSRTAPMACSRGNDACTQRGGENSRTGGPSSMPFAPRRAWRSLCLTLGLRRCDDPRTGDTHGRTMQNGAPPPLNHARDVPYYSWTILPRNLNVAGCRCRCRCRQASSWSTILREGAAVSQIEGYTPRS